MSDCVFCKILAREIPSTTVFENGAVAAFLDVNPMEKGHVLVVPKRHWPTLADVPAGAAEREVRDALADAVRLLAKAALRAGWAGANVLQCNGEAAGQTVGHLHFHVIPRPAGGAVPPAFESGAARYADDAERAAVAEKLRAAVAAVLAEEAAAAAR
ncbi:MAG: HIT domain-containing protein [Kiritimatiellae bacterium]|nr:HIT domain-containing protein [Kiritimatiellia bacterium]